MRKTKEPFHSGGKPPSAPGLSERLSRPCIVRSRQASGALLPLCKMRTVSQLQRTRAWPYAARGPAEHELKGSRRKEGAGGTFPMQKTRPGETCPGETCL